MHKAAQILGANAALSLLFCSSLTTCSSAALHPLARDARPLAPAVHGGQTVDLKRSAATVEPTRFSAIS